MMLRVLLLLLALAMPSSAQETVVTGISTDNIALDATFDGSEIFVFGAVRREGEAPTEAGPLDIIITIKGPPARVVVRRKDRVLGIWVNTASVRVRNAPSFYAIASTRPIPEILSETERLRHGIGIDQAVRLVAGSDTANARDFGEALARIRLGGGLYSVLENGVRLAEETLFQAHFAMPANLVEGDYIAEFFLVRETRVISSGATTIRVEKTGIERWAYNLSQDRPFAYGLLAIAVALFAGWLAASAFRLVRR